MPELRGRLRLVRPEDLLVLDVEFANLRLTDDGRQVERIDPGAPAVLTVHLPSCKANLVAETAGGRVGWCLPGWLRGGDLYPSENP